MAERLLFGTVLDSPLGPKFEAPLFFNVRFATAEDITAHVAALPDDEAQALLAALLRESDHLEAVLSCRACGRSLELQVRPGEHDGFGNETAPRRAWLACADGECELAGVWVTTTATSVKPRG